jgi:hypothetical protein
VIKVNRVNFWLQGIGYPFQVDDYLESPDDLKDIYATTVNIDKIHYIYSFSTLYDGRTLLDI